MTHSPEIVIVGAGLVGRAAAIVAAQAGYRVLHLAPPGGADARTSALMQPAVDFLQDTGLIDSPAAVGIPLASLRIIDMTGRRPRAPEANFRAAEFGLDAFGWNIANTALAETMRRAAAEAPPFETRELSLTAARRSNGLWYLTLSDGALVETALLVGADGKNSTVRAAAGIAVQRHDYDQAALVCDLDLVRPIGTCSIEFHYPHGPFTLVPAGGNRANLVWIDRRDTLDAAAADPDALPAVFAERSRRLFGTVTPATRTVVFPLSRLSVDRAGANGAVLVGESAHAFPPIGAQGLNLGLRDVAALAQALRDHREATSFADAIAETYAARQTPDMHQTGLFVSSLFGTLTGDGPVFQLPRAMGLAALNAVPPLRRAAFAFGMGRR